MTTTPLLNFNTLRHLRQNLGYHLKHDSHYSGSSRKYFQSTHSYTPNHLLYLPSSEYSAVQGFVVSDTDFADTGYIAAPILLTTESSTGGITMTIHPSLDSHFSEQTRPHVNNLISFFETSRDEQALRTTYLYVFSVVATKYYIQSFGFGRNGVEPSSRLAAVLVLLFERDGMLRVLVTTRGKNLKTHGGQTSLPGGKMDAEDNRDVFTTAYREANEEVSLPKSSLHIHTLGTLDLQPFHNLVVTPVVALLTDMSVLDELKPRKGEVDHIFSHPVEAFLTPSLAADHESLVPHGSEYWPHESRYHYHKDHIIQTLGGMTYRLHAFQTSASSITGFTADVMIRVAEIAYQRQAEYERYAFDQIQSSQALVEAFEENRVKSQAPQ